MIREKTRAYLEMRARQSNIDLDKLNLDCGVDMSSDDPDLQDIYEVSIIWDGSLDEDFIIQSIYEVNIADWVAELLAGEASRCSDSPPWQVLVNEYVPEDAGVQRYQVNNEGWDGGEAPPEWYESTGIPSQS